LPLQDQVLTLGRLAQSRKPEATFAPGDVDDLMDEIGLPPPAKVSNILATLEKAKLVTRVRKVRGAWKLTPEGKAHAETIASDMDLAALMVEAAQPLATVLADTSHPVIPPSLAPPALIGPLREFLAEHPFERNVFGMTRFPGSPDDDVPDPLAAALERAADVCKRHGLEFHLASDRAIVDDLWANVAAHMWACRFGIGFFEARSERGLNYNLNIEVGSCLVLGRRLALLKDESLKAMPTDLVGHIYYGVDLDDPSTVEAEVDSWIVNSLRLA